MSYQQLSKTSPKARKEYSCIWCSEKILIGETHIKEVGEYEGDFQSNRWHPECHNAAQMYFEENGEDCFEAYENKRGSTEEKSNLISELLEEVKSSVGENTMTIPVDKFLEMKKKLDDCYDWLHLFVEIGDGGNLFDSLHKKYGDKYLTAYGWRTGKSRCEKETLDDGGKWVSEQLSNITKFENYSEKSNLVVGNKIEQILKTPSDWQKEMPEAIIWDCDGWREPNYKNWNEPITKKEYLTRRAQCTCKFDFSKIKPENR